MTCERCKGLILKNQFVELGECYDLMGVSGWRCVNYGGDTVDAGSEEPGTAACCGHVACGRHHRNHSDGFV